MDRESTSASNSSALPIIQYWHREEVPGDVAEVMSTFRRKNPEMPHMVFDEKTAEGFIAERFTAREVAAFRTCAVPSMQSDYFRYCAVLALGGLYADVSFHCAKSVQALIPAEGRGGLFRAPAGHIIAGLLAFGSPGHDLLELALEIATANIERRMSKRIYYTTSAPILIFLTGLPRLGSLDAAIARFDGTFLDKVIRAYCEVIDDYSRVARACQEIETLAADEYHPFIRPVDERPPSRLNDPHWSQVDPGDIYRT